MAILFTDISIYPPPIFGFTSGVVATTYGGYLCKRVVVRMRALARALLQRATEYLEPGASCCRCRFDTQRHNRELPVRASESPTPQKLISYILVIMADTPRTIASAAAGDLDSRASRFIAQEKFNRSLTLPATDAHGELTVTYAIGGLDSAEAPTLLFIGGLFGGRLLASIVDYEATKLGVRIVVADR